MSGKQSLEIPSGWKRTSPYSIGKGAYSVCLVTVGGVKFWELWGPGNGPSLCRCKHADGGFQKCIDAAEEIKEIAA